MPEYGWTKRKETSSEKSPITPASIPITKIQFSPAFSEPSCQNLTRWC